MSATDPGGRSFDWTVCVIVGSGSGRPLAPSAGPRPGGVFLGGGGWGGRGGGLGGGGGAGGPPPAHRPPPPHQSAPRRPGGPPVPVDRPACRTAAPAG